MEILLRFSIAILFLRCFPGFLTPALVVLLTAGAAMAQQAPTPPGSGTAPISAPSAGGRHPELNGDQGPGGPSSLPEQLPRSGVREPLGGRIPDTDPGWIRRQPAGPIAGGAVLPNGREVRPVGSVIPVGLLPLGLAISPDGRWLAVLNNGLKSESVQIIDTRTNEVVSTVKLPMAFVGIVFSQDGERLWVAGGGSSSVFQFSLDPTTGAIQQTGEIPVGGYPTGLALSRDGKRLFCTENYGNHVAMMDAATSQLLGSVPTGHMPYDVVQAGPAGNLWVTTWVDGTLQEITQDGRLLRSLPVGKLAGPIAASPGGKYLYACSVNEDRMVALTLDPTTVAPMRQVSFAPYPGAPVGSVPGAVAVNPATGDIFVALSGLNAVAVVDPVTLTVRGLIPTGWYPAALAISPDGSHLYVAAAKGLGSGPNVVSRKSVATLNQGMVYAVPLTGVDSAATNLPAWTEIVFVSNLFREPATDTAASGTPPAEPGLPPVHHVVYVVKENRTYDQVLGDLGRGASDPSVAYYGKAVTPNLHALADRFVVGDNFYSDGEVSVQGHEWTLGANSPDYTERTWAQIYGVHGRLDDITTAPVSYPAGGFLIHECVDRGVSCRMYGDVVMRDTHGRPLPGLAQHVCSTFRGWDLHYQDVRREAAWEAEFKKGIFPQYSYVWLPNDHTAATKPGYPTPRAMVADNDLALGRLVSAISHSPYWKDTVIFVTEDDSQDGFDHVDAHRTPLLIISPWVRSGMITHRHYSQVSITRTIELLLRLPALSQFDDRADPILDTFTDHPDLRPFDPTAETIDLKSMNTMASIMSHESGGLDLSAPDTSADGLLQRILLADARAGDSRARDRSRR